MPRPKRLKAAPSAPARLVRNTTSISVEVPQLHDELREQYTDMTGVGNSEEEVVSPVKKRGRGRPPKKKPVPVAQHDSEPANSIPGSDHAAPEAPAEEYLLEDIDLGSSSPSVEMGRRDRGSTTFESSVLSVTNFRRRPRQPSILGRGPARERSSSVESNRADSNALASMSSRNASALSLGNFRRRPRQPSILGRARSSSIGLDTDMGTPAQPASALRLGNFKRRARESSILGTGRKPQQDRPADDEEDEEDFDPEDESTPLHLSKSAPVDNSPTVSSNPRKRKLSAARDPQPSSVEPSSEASHGQEDLSEAPPLSDEVADEYDIPSSPPGAPMSSIEGVDEDPISDTMAPPQSSSSQPDSPLDSPSPPRMMQRFQSHGHQPRGRRPARTPPPATQDSPISSPPPLTHSPNRPGRGAAGVTPANKPRGRGPAAPPSTFSTAQLQNLLPRRRRGETVNRDRDPYDIHSSDDEIDVSGLASDDDELTNLTVAPQSRRPNLFIRRPAPLRRPGRPRNPSKPRPETASGKATYGARPNATSDKENEDYDPDHSLAPLPDDDVDGDANPGSGQAMDQEKELQDAAKKFKEVDKWELEFEDVTASSSSPAGAR